MIHYSPPLNRPHLLLQWKRGLVKRVGFPEGEYLVVFYSIRGLAIGEMGSIKGVAFGGRGLIRGVIFGGVGPLKRGHYCTHYRPCSDFLYYNLTPPPISRGLPLSDRWIRTGQLLVWALRTLTTIQLFY
jgi:hypothetical protein